MSLSGDQTIYPRELHHLEKGGLHFVVDPARPNWVTTNDAGARLLKGIVSPTPVAQVQQSQAAGGAEGGDVLAFLEEAVDAQLLGVEPQSEETYPGRSRILTPTRLEEFWVQINDFCNLSCEHCMVSSSPEGGKGLPPETVRSAVEQALELGAEWIGITGGEPFFREDLFDLFEFILADPHRSATVLSNGTRISGKLLERLKAVANERLELRISLDGPDPEVNDPIRGQGSFRGAIRGIRNALETDARVTVTMAINGANAPHADRMPGLLKELGIRRLHVLWPFQRGRAIEEGQDSNLTPSVDDLIEGYRRIRAAARAEGISFFTYSSWKMRIDGAPGLKYDMANHCWSSLCLYTNGHVYPAPALTQHPELSLGDLSTSTLRELWENSDVSRRFRAASVIDRPQCRDCHYRFLCGGGDVDHIYNTSRMQHGTEGDLVSDDPYCDLYKEMLADAMRDWSGSAPEGAGPAPPKLVRRMGHRPNLPPHQLTSGESMLATIPST